MEVGAAWGMLSGQKARSTYLLIFQQELTSKFIAHIYKEFCMSRNFGLGSRNMADAGRMACDQAVRRGLMSFSSAASVRQRWSKFVVWLKENTDIGRMERIETSMVVEFGRELAEEVVTCELSASYAQNLVSAINSVMKLATKNEWQPVSPTKDCKIAQRQHSRETMPGGIDRERVADAIAVLPPRTGAVVALCRDLGLRSKEASLFDAKSALNEAIKAGIATITEGSKGGRLREVPIDERGLQSLKNAAAQQGNDRSMIPTNRSWAQWRNVELHEAREIVQQFTGGSLHDLRAAWACERYKELTGHHAPICGGQRPDKVTDLGARKQISAELGHGRAEIVAAYIGRW